MPTDKVVKLSTVRAVNPVPAVVPVPKSHRQTATPLPHTFWERRARPRYDSWAEWLAAEAQAQEYGSG